MILTMGYFNRDSNNRSGRDNRGGGRGFGGGRDSGRRDDGPREMFKTICSNCGKECEVPFKPTTGKPVYCSDCFETMGGRSADGGRNERPERRDRPSFDRHQVPAPRADNSKQFEDLSKKHESLMTKIDKIIDLLTPKTEEVVKVEETKEPKVKTPKTKKVKSVKEDK